MIESQRERVIIMAACGFVAGITLTALVFTIVYYVTRGTNFNPTHEKMTLPLNPNLTPGEAYELKEHKFMNRTCYVARDHGTALGISCYETKNEGDIK